MAVCGCCCGCLCVWLWLLLWLWLWVRACVCVCVCGWWWWCGGGGGGVLLLVFRGKILGFVKDELPRNHLPRMLSLITNEGDIEVPSSSSPQTVWRLWSTCKGQCTLVLVEVRCRCLCRCVAGGLCGGLCGGVCWLFELVVNVLCVCRVLCES